MKPIWSHKQELMALNWSIWTLVRKRSLNLLMTWDLCKIWSVWYDSKHFKIYFFSIMLIYKIRLQVRPILTPSGFSWRVWAKLLTNMVWNQQKPKKLLRLQRTLWNSSKLLCRMLMEIRYEPKIVNTTLQNNFKCFLLVFLGCYFHSPPCASR